MGKKNSSLLNYILIFLAIGLLAYKVYSSKYFQNDSDRTYTMDVGYTSERNKLSFEDQIPSLQEEFKKQNINMNIRYINIGSTIEDSKLEWDFSVASPMFVMMKRKYGQRVKPLLWDSDCNANAVAMVMLRRGETMEEMGNADKKILLFGYGDQSGTVLRAIKEWGLEGAELYETTDDLAAYHALKNGKFDVAISDAKVMSTGTVLSTLIGPRYNKYNLKILATTNYKIPCRMISYAEGIDEKVVTKFKNVVQNFTSIVWPEMREVDIAEFDSYASEYDWDELDKIKKLVKPAVLESVETE